MMLAALLHMLRPLGLFPEGSSGGEEHESDDLLSHIIDHVVVPLPTVMGIDMSITYHTICLWVASALVLLVIVPSFRNAKLVPSGMANALEAVVVFLRQDVIGTYLGHDGKRFEPLILTFFFFVLFNNLLGLVPAGAAATSDLSVTAVLALIVFGTGLYAGMQRNGVIGFWKGLIPSGVPGFLLPLIGVLEVLSLFIKHFVLAMRLFANMTAGHIAILALIGIIFTFKSWIVLPFPIVTAAAIGVLETLVSFLQAYIFTLLSAVFIGAAVHQEH